MTPTCRQCGPAEPITSWQTFSNNTQHIRAACPRCGAFLGYLPQEEPWLTKAGQPPALPRGMFDDLPGPN